MLAFALTLTRIFNLHGSNHHRNERPVPSGHHPEAKGIGQAIRRMDGRAGRGVYQETGNCFCIAALAAIVSSVTTMISTSDIVPLAPLITSLSIFGGVGLVALRARDFVATRSELAEVKHVIEMCARKEDLESLRATLNLHISQAATAIHELRIDVAKLDERNQARLEKLDEKNQVRWEKLMEKMADKSSE